MEENTILVCHENATTPAGVINFQFKQFNMNIYIITYEKFEPLLQQLIGKMQLSMYVWTTVPVPSQSPPPFSVVLVQKGDEVGGWSC